MVRELEEKIIRGNSVTRREALSLAKTSGRNLPAFFCSANSLRTRFRGNHADLCAIINARSGACSENCAYCAQSSASSADIVSFPLVEKKIVTEKAREAKRGGAKRFCIVTSGRRASKRDLSRIGEMVSEVRSVGLLPCATLGLLSREDLVMLKESGLERYHHNLETSERFFPKICTSHTYKDKMKTVEAAISTGLSLCSGGIFGLGETWEDRVDMGFALREINPDSVPINFLIPIKGTRLGARSALEPMEALKIVSLYRFILPEREIRVCGGRLQTLGEFNSFAFLAGADGLLIGNYLTTPGRNFGDDLRIIRQFGLSISGVKAGRAK